MQSETSQNVISAYFTCPTQLCVLLTFDLTMCCSCQVMMLCLLSYLKMCSCKTTGTHLIYAYILSIHDTVEIYSF